MSKDNNKKVVKENNSCVSVKSFNNYTKKIDKYHSENKNHVFNVRMVEDKTAVDYNASVIILVLFLILGFFVVFNYYDFIECIKNDGNVIEFLLSRLKELAYASGFGFLIVFANSIVFRRKK